MLLVHLPPNRSRATLHVTVGVSGLVLRGGLSLSLPVPPRKALSFLDEGAPEDGILRTGTLYPKGPGRCEVKASHL